jgi:4-amino-4-deoxy-L-arabinose transferase-like glycosyltransferase
MNKVLNFIRENKFLVLILLVGTILRFYKINLQSLWMDEIYTMNVSNPSNSYGTIITEVNNREGFPYFYFLILKTLYAIFGYSPIVSRGLSAVLGILSIYMIAKLGEKMFSKQAGIFAALILAFSEYAIFISQDARPYTFYLFSVLLTYNFLINYLKDVSKINAIKYGLSLGLLLNVNFFAAINVVSQGILLVLFYFIIDANNRKIYIKYTLLTIIITFILFAPNIYKLLLLSKIESFWIPAPTPETISLILKEFLGNSEVTLFLFSSLFLFFVITIFNTKQLQKTNEIFNDKKTFSFIILSSWAFLFFIVIFLKSYTQTSLFLARYLTSLFPVVILIFGIGLAMIKNNIIKSIFITILITFIFFNHTIVRGYYKGPNKTQFREASQLIIDKNKNNETVYTSLKYWFDYYLNNNNIKFNVVEKPNLETIINEMIANPSSVKPFWYTDAHGRPFQLSENAQQFVNSNFYIDENFDGFDAWTKHFIMLKDVKKDVDISEFGTLKNFNGTSFKFNLEVFENTNDILNASGWAYFDEQDATESKIDLVLIKDGFATKIPSQKVNRPDVTSYFKSSFNLSNSGFTASFNLKDLPSGNYRLGILIVDKKTNKSGLNLTDKIINKI